jgi:hypothetical protein
VGRSFVPPASTGSDRRETLLRRRSATPSYPPESISSCVFAQAQSPITEAPSSDPAITGEIEHCSSHQKSPNVTVVQEVKVALEAQSVAALRIVPYTEMNIWFTVYEGSLQFAMLEYRTALRVPNSPVVHVQQGMCSHDLLPTMWAHTGSGEISSRFVGLSQKLEESHGFPSPDDI